MVEDRDQGLDADASRGADERLVEAEADEPGRRRGAVLGCDGERRDVPRAADLQIEPGRGEQLAGRLSPPRLEVDETFEARTVLGGKDHSHHPGGRRPAMIDDAKEHARGFIGVVLFRELCGGIAERLEEDLLLEKAAGRGTRFVVGEHVGTEGLGGGRVDHLAHEGSQLFRPNGLRSDSSQIHAVAPRRNLLKPKEGAGVVHNIVVEWAASIDPDPRTPNLPRCFAALRLLRAVTPRPDAAPRRSSLQVVKRATTSAQKERATISSGSKKAAVNSTTSDASNAAQV